MRTDFFQALGHKILEQAAALGRAVFFLLEILWALPSIFTRGWQLLSQVYAVGVLSLVIIMVSGLFVGMVLALQLYNAMINYGAEQSLGPLLALSTVRELGPVVTALLFAGRAGSALTAEIGLMKATEQLSAMEMMAVDPFKRVLVPRFLAGFFSMPLLGAIFSAVAIYGGFLVAVGLLGLDQNYYWAQMQAVVEWNEDVVSGLIKCVVFGIVASWIALFQGYDAIPTSEGVSRATTRTVVYTSLAVLGLDFILTALMYGE